MCKIQMEQTNGNNRPISVTCTDDFDKYFSCKFIFQLGLYLICMYLAG